MFVFTFVRVEILATLTKLVAVVDNLLPHVIELGVESS